MRGEKVSKEIFSPSGGGVLVYMKRRSLSKASGPCANTNREVSTAKKTTTTENKLSYDISNTKKRQWPTTVDEAWSS